MDRLAELKQSLTDLSPDEQLELIRARRAERMTKPWKPVKTKKTPSKRNPKIYDHDAEKNKKFNKVDSLLEGKSLDEIMEIAKRLGVKK